MLRIPMKQKSAHLLNTVIIPAIEQSDDRVLNLISNMSDHDSSLSLTQIDEVGMPKLLPLYFQLSYLIQKLRGRRFLHSCRLHCSDWTGMSSTQGDGCSDERRTTTCHSLHLSVESKGTLRLIFLGMIR